MKAHVVSAVTAASLFLAAPAIADSMSFEDQFFVGFLERITSSETGKAIPADLSSDFAHCYAKVVSAHVSVDHKKSAESLYAQGQQPTPELQAAIGRDIMAFAAQVIALGNDPVGAACPDVAQSYRKYLK